MSEPELTPDEMAYNVAHAELFQLAAYGHFKHWPSGEALPRTEGERQRQTYCDAISRAQARFEAAALRRAAEWLRRIPVQCTALTGPVWYGQGWKDAITELEERADRAEPDPAVGP